MRLELEGQGRSAHTWATKVWLLLPLAVLAGIAADWPITLPTGAAPAQATPAALASVSAPTESAVNAAIPLAGDWSVPSASSVRFKDEAAATDVSTF